MQTLSRFVAKFTSLIVTLLSFLRVLMKGHLPTPDRPVLEGMGHVKRAP
jgi:hypothetical protein